MIILCSVNPDGQKIATFRIKHPRYILSQLLTHRTFSRNSASNRAISTKRLIEQILDDDYIPQVNSLGDGRGMVGGQMVSASCQEEFNQLWIKSRDSAIDTARSMHRLGISKQHVNRVLEPYMMNTLLVTATELDNFFKLRCGEDAQPEIQEVARQMKSLWDYTKPNELDWGEWHSPFNEDLITSVEMCARVSYGNEGKSGVREVGELYLQLKQGGHLSPFEHQAQACKGQWANFNGWKQNRWFEENKWQ